MVKRGVKMKKLLSIVMTLVVLTQFSTAFAYDAKSNDDQKLTSDDITTALENTEVVFSEEDGTTATLYIYKDEEGNVVTSESMPTTRAGGNYADGVLDYAMLHVGLENWKNQAVNVYYYLKTDEYIYGVTQGTAYVSGTSRLNPKTYGSWSMVSSAGALDTWEIRRTLARVNVGTSTEVKVGFKNVIFKLKVGTTHSMPNNSKTVSQSEAL